MFGRIIDTIHLLYIRF